MGWEISTVLDIKDGSRYGGIDICGNYAIVGELTYAGPDGTQVNIGAAYIYQRKNDGEWSLMTRMMGEEGGDLFGVAVSISGSYAIVGASGYDGPDGTQTNIGVAYIYQRKNDGEWSLMTRLMGEEDGDTFGTSVSISGSYAIVGATGYDGPDGNQGGIGAAYIYQRKNDGEWSLMTRLMGEEGGDFFGTSVSISGSYAIVGAPAYDGPDGNQVDIGAAYIYQRKNDGEWSLMTRLMGEEDRDNFGYNLSISGSYAIVGAWGYDGPDGTQTNIGAAYIYQRKNDGEWSLMTRLMGEEENETFGRNVSVSQNYAAVFSESTVVRNGCPVSIYQRKNNGDWVFMKRIISNNFRNNRGITGIRGNGATIDGNQLIAGIRSRDLQGQIRSIAFICQMEYFPRKRSLVL